MANTPLTKEYFDSAFKSVNARFEGLEAFIVHNTQEIISHFNQSQGLQNQRTDQIEAKLDSVAEDVAKIKLVTVDLMGTDRHVHNLVRELKGQGLPLDEKKIFV